MSVACATRKNLYLTSGTLSLKPSALAMCTYATSTDTTDKFLLNNLNILKKMSKENLEQAFCDACVFVGVLIILAGFIQLILKAFSHG